MVDKIPPKRYAADPPAEPELEVIPASVTATSMRVCAARLDESVEPEEFAVLVEDLVESVRHEERAIAKAFKPAPAPAARDGGKWMSAADKAQIREEYQRVTGDVGRKMAPRGWKQATADKYGYTLAQITAAVGPQP